MATITGAMRVILSVLLSLPVLAGSALGWGCEGHQMIALIARAHLSPAASAAVDQLLTQNPIDPALNRFCHDRPADPMADSATWADDVRNHEKTGEWHYVDIPLTVTDGGTLDAWCPPIGPAAPGKDRPGCVTKAIEYEWAILRDKTRSGPDRATALRYVIHFVGDMHQPLHDSDNDDHGGNCTAMAFFKEEKPANLHAIWDYKLIQRELTLRKTTQIEYARLLDQRFSDKWDTWGNGKIDPVAWAWEAHSLAVKAAYGDLTPPIRFETPNPRADCDAERDKVAALSIATGQKYFDETMPVIDEQLAKAGYRLADLLNRSF